ncbi:MAG: 16S rRNA (guanine(966)-N(2))-methyltransferase RsmD [Acholeplasmatales bacterium]|nr:16S rRNA (guanine(966)-N(2))-methyltransferase RsmD [Acholeplasmatales bacterium]
MRINAGKYRNHNIEMTNLETTRETSDKVRQAIFNLIGQFFDGEVVLDLFAGSGAMGLEAISRGASKAYFNDINAKALEVVKKNIAKLRVDDQCELKNLDYKAYLESSNQKFDIIFLDPPYKMNNVDEILKLIKEKNLLAQKGIIAFEMETQTNPESQYYSILKDRSYGIKRVVIYEGEK